MRQRLIVGRALVLPGGRVRGALRGARAAAMAAPPAGSSSTPAAAAQPSPPTSSRYPLACACTRSPCTSRSCCKWWTRCPWMPRRRPCACLWPPWRAAPARPSSSFFPSTPFKSPCGAPPSPTRPGCFYCAPPLRCLCPCWHVWSHPSRGGPPSHTLAGTTRVWALHWPGLVSGGRHSKCTPPTRSCYRGRESCPRTPPPRRRLPPTLAC